MEIEGQGGRREGEGRGRMASVPGSLDKGGARYPRVHYYTALNEDIGGGVV